MSEIKKNRKDIRIEAKKLIAADKQREREARTKRKVENQGKPLTVKWKSFRQEIIENRLVRRKRKEKIKELDGSEKKNQKKLVKAYNRIRFRPRRWLIFAGVIFIIIVGFNIAAAISYETNAIGTPDVEEAKDISRIKAQEVVGEGIVLLKNEGNLLPLGNKKVNVFGSSSIKPGYGGGASGAVNANYAIDFYEALTYAGIEYNESLYDLYGNFVETGKVNLREYEKPARPGVFDVLLPNLLIMFASQPDEMDVAQIPANVLQESENFSDTAVVFISRRGIESIVGGYADILPDSLNLSDLEKAMLETATQNHENVIVILNTGNAMELSWVDDPIYNGKIKSVLWIGMVGEVGFNAVADVMVGNINPSGRLVETYVKDVLNTTPAAGNTGNYVYVDNQGVDTGRRYVNYDEGIYVGYRYFETRFGEDETRYDSIVQYPFGYGLSYTTFEQKITNAPAMDEDGNISVIVEVKNTGSVAGKEVVQLYFTPPYSVGGIEKARKNLVAFTKTDFLSPGSTETVTLQFHISEMASYDSREDVQAWVVEDGTYTITLGKNAHDAWAEVNLEVSGISKDDIAANAKIKNLFSDSEQGLDLMTRADFEGTYPEIRVQGTTMRIPDELLQEQEFTTPAGFDREAVKSGQQYEKTIMFAELQGKSYDDPIWQQYVEQFTAEEMIDFVADMGYKVNPVERLGIPALQVTDGPAQFKDMFGTMATLAFPSENLLASTWNVELAQQMANAMAGEAVTYGIDIWYAPAVNIHRSALGARNFEYFSEDPLISGKMGAAFIRGARDKGLVLTVKHFALNEQESNRATYGVYTWATEQAMREIYLKAFEISIKEGNPYGVMTSLNRVGPDWSSANKALVTDLLRNEWEFMGFVTSDATTSATGGYTSIINTLMAGNDGTLSMFNTGGTIKSLKEAYEKEPEYTTYLMQQAMHNIGYMILQTNTGRK